MPDVATCKNASACRQCNVIRRHIRRNCRRRIACRDREGVLRRVLKSDGRNCPGCIICPPHDFERRQVFLHKDHRVGGLRVSQSRQHRRCNGCDGQKVVAGAVNVCDQRFVFENVNSLMRDHEHIAVAGVELEGDAAHTIFRRSRARYLGDELEAIATFRAALRQDKDVLRCL